jgi:anaphase-promoting complex subunit 3
LEQENDGDSEGQALKYYELACKYAPESPMIQFRRIRYLVSMDKIVVSPHPSSIGQDKERERERKRGKKLTSQEAISSLEPLSKQAPDEANIFFLLGKCYLRSGENVKATIAFTSARELQPKLEGAIKTAMENDGEEGDEEEEE